MPVVEKQSPRAPLRVAEFFAGIGLVRRAIEAHGFQVIFSNDIEPDKLAMYAANFDAEHFRLGDVRAISGADVPHIDLATASFPCTDLSLAGNRAGLCGEGSGMFWEFARILGEMGERRPRALLLENVVGFATSRGGADMADAIARLNKLGYVCDLFVLDARHFVPQSRPRLFIVGSRGRSAVRAQWEVTELRPAWVKAFVDAHPLLGMQPLPLPLPPKTPTTIDACVERLDPHADKWWDAERLGRFLQSLSPLQAERLEKLRARPGLGWATAYRRTRHGQAVWEIRADAVSGCLRTARGGSSKQAVVEAGAGEVRVRWMLATEYARLQGAADFKLGGVSENAALFGFGDAVCVPAVGWIAKTCLRPLLDGKLSRVAKHSKVVVTDDAQGSLRFAHPVS